MIGYEARPDKERKTKRVVSREAKRRTSSLSRTPFKWKSWKKG